MHKVNTTDRLKRLSAIASQTRSQLKIATKRHSVAKKIVAHTNLLRNSDNLHNRMLSLYGGANSVGLWEGPYVRRYSVLSQDPVYMKIGEVNHYSFSKPNNSYGNEAFLKQRMTSRRMDEKEYQALLKISSQELSQRMSEDSEKELLDFLKKSGYNLLRNNY